MGTAPIGIWRPGHVSQVLQVHIVTILEIQVYHVSRESFLYLSEFYIGEVLPEIDPWFQFPRCEPLSK